MSKIDFRKEIYKRKQEQDRQNMFQARALKKQGYNNALIANMLGIPEVIVEKYVEEK